MTVTLKRNMIRRLIRKGIQWNEKDHDSLKLNISKIQRNEVIISGKLFDERHKIKTIKDNIKKDEKYLNELKAQYVKLQDGLNDVRAHKINTWNTKFTFFVIAILIVIFWSKLK